MARTLTFRNHTRPKITNNADCVGKLLTTVVKKSVNNKILVITINHVIWNH